MKLYKVLKTIAHPNMDATCVVGYDYVTQWFDNLDDAIRYAKEHDYDLNSTSKSRIWEYTISSVRELEEKKRPVEVVTKTETIWE